MERKSFQPRGILFRNTSVRCFILLATVVLVGNLNAIVDSFLHPEIPYFDNEHLIVGSVTSFVTAILFGAIIIYTHHLEQAVRKIGMLESFLPICSNCKKIRISDSNVSKMESWQSVESYITEHTSTRFTHSVCPDCVKELYPGFDEEEHSG